MPSTDSGDDVKDDGLQVNLPDCLPASSCGDALERPIASRSIQIPEAPPPDYAAVLKRLERLEYHRRGLLFLCVVASVAAISCCCFLQQERAAARQLKEWPVLQQKAAEPQAAQPGILEVRQIVFVDAAGNRKESIKLDEAGGIAFCDPQGVKRVLPYNSPEGDTGLNILSPDGKQRVSLGVLKNGDGAVAVRNVREHIVYLDAKGLSIDANGKPQISMGMTEGGPNITIFDAKGAILFNKP